MVPFNSFSEFNKAEGGDVWFALDESRSKERQPGVDSFALFAFGSFRGLPKVLEPRQSGHAPADTLDGFAAIRNSRLRISLRNYKVPNGKLNVTVGTAASRPFLEDC